MGESLDGTGQFGRSNGGCKEWGKFMVNRVVRSIAILAVAAVVRNFSSFQCPGGGGPVAGNPGHDETTVIDGGSGTLLTGPGVYFFDVVMAQRMMQVHA